LSVCVVFEWTTNSPSVHFVFLRFKFSIWRLHHKPHPPSSRRYQLFLVTSMIVLFITGIVLTWRSFHDPCLLHRAYFPLINCCWLKIGVVSIIYNHRVCAEAELFLSVVWLNVFFFTAHEICIFCTKSRSINAICTTRSVNFDQIICIQLNLKIWS
jgi:hypothetical protein